MKNNTRTFVSLAVALVFVGFTGQGSAAEGADEAQIRQARAAMNTGFAKHDLAAMTAFVTDRVTWAGPAWRIVGKPQLEQNHKEYWQGRPDATWDYTPDKIDVFKSWHWLSEEGTWLQKWTAADGLTELRGAYLAFWREEPAGKWMLDAHLFITTSCTPAERAFCRRDTRQPVPAAR
jgi:hypothetical protein